MWAENELECILKIADGEWICLRQHGEGGVFIERYEDEYTASERDEYGGTQTGHITFKRENLDKMFELIDKWT